MTLSSKYAFGQLVYLRTDPEQLARMVIAVKFIPNAVMYELSLANESSEHLEIEITAERNTLLAIS